MFEDMLYFGIALIVFGAGGLFILLLLGEAFKKKPPCSICGQKIDTSSFVSLTDGSRYHKNCFQKMLVDKGGICPVCSTSMEVGESLFRDGENWYHLNCYETSAFKQERMPSNQIVVLANAVRVYCGIPTSEEAMNEFIWGITDPVYGLYRKSQKQIGEMSQETARATIEELYQRYPKSVTNYLKTLAVKLPKVRLTINSLLNILQSEKKIISSLDPLILLKTRFAKGEISKEQYEEMKKTLEK